MNYYARIAGTHENDSKDLVNQITTWAFNGYNISLEELFQYTTGPPTDPKIQVVTVAGITAGLVALVVVMAMSVVVWRCGRAVTKRRKTEE